MSTGQDNERRDRPLGVLIVDDHDVYRRGLSRLLAEEGLEITGEARNGATAVRLAAELKPQVILMDLNMPGMSGIEATRAIIAHRADARVVMLTLFEEEDRVIEALLAGAAGYVLKSDSLESLIATINGAAQGDAIIPPRVGDRVLRLLRERSRRRPTGPTVELSERELEVLRLMAEGLDNAAIARRLYISPNTVKNHAANIYEKLGVDNRLQAAMQALRKGLLD
jgi:two-component system, NarL family, response regulator DegU